MSGTIGLRATLQNSPFKTETRPYKGSCIPLWIVFVAASAVLTWQFLIGKATSDLISISALVVLSLSGCVIFIATINYFNHIPIKLTVTSHAIRIDDGDEQLIIRLVDLFEIQRSRSWFVDEIVLKAVGDRGVSLENLRQPDEFLNAVVTNASTLGSSRRINGRAAAFSLVTKHSHLKLQEMVGPKKYGPEANSLELANNFTSYLSTFPLAALLPAILTTALIFLSLIAFEVAPFRAGSLGISALIAPSMFLVVCYVLFVERQVSINEDQIVIETSSERIFLPKNAVTNVSSRRAGLSRVIMIDTATHGTIKLLGYSNPKGIEDAIRWVTTSAEVRNEAAKEGEIQTPGKLPQRFSEVALELIRKQPPR